MSLQVKLQATFLLNFAKLINYATELGFEVTAGELLRPPEMQKIYVKTGRSKTMESKHLRKLAGDLNFFLDGVYCLDKTKLEPLGKYWESLHPSNRWGGNFKNFKDVPHFEMNV